MELFLSLGVLLVNSAVVRPSRGDLSQLKDEGISLREVPNRHRKLVIGDLFRLTSKLAVNP